MQVKLPPGPSLLLRAAVLVPDVTEGNSSSSSSSLLHTGTFIVPEKAALQGRSGLV